MFDGYRCPLAIKVSTIISSFLSFSTAMQQLIPHFSFTGFERSFCPSTFSTTLGGADMYLVCSQLVPAVRFSLINCHYPSLSPPRRCRPTGRLTSSHRSLSTLSSPQSSPSLRVLLLVRPCPPIFRTDCCVNCTIRPLEPPRLPPSSSLAVDTVVCKSFGAKNDATSLFSSTFSFMLSFTWCLRHRHHHFRVVLRRHVCNSCAIFLAAAVVIVVIRWRRETCCGYACVILVAMMSSFVES